MLRILLLGLLLVANMANAEENIKTTVFAGGCFWCMEPPYDKTDGVLDVISGYSGGERDDATYKKVSSGATDHIEVIQVKYDSSKVSYEELLEIFWKNIDPTVKNRQFCDVGAQYRSAIFYQNGDEKKLAEKTKKQVAKKLGTEVFTEIIAFKEFYPAEEYHQDYYKKNPIRYKYYRFSCGRDKRLEDLWGQEG